MGSGPCRTTPRAENAQITSRAGTLRTCRGSTSAAFAVGAHRYVGEHGLGDFYLPALIACAPATMLLAWCLVKVEALTGPGSTVVAPIGIGLAVAAFALGDGDLRSADAWRIGVRSHVPSSLARSAALKGALTSPARPHPDMPLSARDAGSCRCRRGRADERTCPLCWPDGCTRG